MKVAFEKEILFWNEKFSGEDGSLTLLPYSKAPSHAAPSVLSVSGTLSGGAAQRVIQMSKGVPLAAYMILLAGVQVLLYRYTGDSAVLVGMPVVKKAQETRRPINHTVILKNRIGDESTFKSVLNELKVSLPEAIRHQQIPFLKMTEKLELQYADGVPVVNTLVSLNELHGTDVGGNVVCDCLFQFRLETVRSIFRSSTRKFVSRGLYDRGGRSSGPSAGRRFK